MTGCIVGWAHSKFGKIEGQDVEALIVEAATNAMADAGVGEPGLVTHTIPIGDWGEPLPLHRKGKRILSAA